MMHKAWSSIEEAPYCFSRSSVKFQGHTALKIVEFDPNWAFPDCNSSLKSPMATKWCTKLEVAWKRCPIVFSCDQAALQMVFSVCLSVCPSVRLSVCLSHLFDYVPIIVSSWNFQELLPITNGYEIMHKAWSSLEEVPYCFSRSSVKFQGHTALKNVEFDPNWAFSDCNSSFNTPMVTKWCTKLKVA